MNYINSPIGYIEFTAENDYLVQISFTGKEDNYIKGLSRPIYCKIEQQLRSYFTSKLKLFNLPIAPMPNSFTGRVWQELQRIPYGKTASYQEIAHKIGNRRAYRAVANACGWNKLPIIIPCHRVIASDGSIGGYNGGIARKRWLLRHERAMINSEN